VRKDGGAILGNVFVKQDACLGPSTTASPSIVKLVVLINSAAAVIAANRTVQSYALRR
jgi:hypothetical protein